MNAEVPKKGQDARNVPGAVSTSPAQPKDETYPIMKSSLPCLAALFLALASASAADAVNPPAPLTLKLWPEGAPGKMAAPSQKTLRLIEASKAKAISNVTDPDITIYQPEHTTGTSVIVAPGGGYHCLVMGNNGTEPCAWLNSLGLTAILLKYRTPTRDEANPSEKPSADALRAIGLVRHHASEWGLDPRRVGLLAFSAGGTMLGHVACDRGPRSYEFNPQFDDIRGPDFGIMAYGGGFLDKDDKTKFKAGISVPADAPPMFFASANDDKIADPQDVTMLYLEYQKRGIPTELHIYAKGGHGFGVKQGPLPVHTWTQRCAEWMVAMGFLPKP